MRRTFSTIQVHPLRGLRLLSIFGVRSSRASGSTSESPDSRLVGADLVFEGNPSSLILAHSNPASACISADFPYCLSRFISREPHQPLPLASASCHGVPLCFSPLSFVAAGLPLPAVAGRQPLLLTLVFILLSVPIHLIGTLHIPARDSSFFPSRSSSLQPPQPRVLVFP